MTANRKDAAKQEARYLEVCLAELGHADRLRDEVRRFYAVEEIAGIILHTDFPQIKADAAAALKQSAAKAKRVRAGLSDTDRLKEATRSNCLPVNCLVALDADGELVVREL